MHKVSITTLICFWLVTGLSQTISVSTTSTRVLYQWVENPLQIVVENELCKNIIAKAEKGKIKGKDCAFIYTTDDTVFGDVIKVGIKKNGKIKWLFKEALHVKKIPDPEVSAGGYHGKNDTVQKSYLINQFELSLPINDFGICSYTNETRQAVISYRLKILRNSKEIYTERSDNNLISDSFKEFLANDCLANDCIIFDEIVALLYQKEKRKLEQKMMFVLK